MPNPRCSRSVLAATSGCPVSPVLPTSPTDRTPAASQSIGVLRHGLVLGRPRCTAQPASANSGHNPGSRIHPLRPVREAVVPPAANPAVL